ncbi:hypothetical protein AVEN_184189-1 [Araneus ventricosus]|uniref:Uncharacterized protein n=1 Tax=Araneus ventricosus TaxID=182803 RepID=A0A4Y2BML4_ARAVE
MLSGEKEYLKYHFHIVSCIMLIENACESVTKTTLTSTWKRTLAESVVECYIETIPCGANNQRDCIFGQDQGIGARSYGGKFVRGGVGNSKAEIFKNNKNRGML